jgi:Na+-translocating ferredoxin:NAD+ oxidoreductase RnfG subunit
MKLESNFRNMVVVLTLISLIAAGILGAVYTVTAEPIQQAKTAKQQQAIQQQARQNFINTMNQIQTNTNLNNINNSLQMQNMHLQNTNMQLFNINNSINRW